MTALGASPRPPTSAAPESCTRSPGATKARYCGPAAQIGTEAPHRPVGARASICQQTCCCCGTASKCGASRRSQRRSSCRWLRPAFSTPTRCAPAAPLQRLAPGASRSLGPAKGPWPIVSSSPPASLGLRPAAPADAAPTCRGARRRGIGSTRLRPPPPPQQPAASTGFNISEVVAALPRLSAARPPCQRRATPPPLRTPPPLMIPPGLPSTPSPPPPPLPNSLLGSATHRA